MQRQPHHAGTRGGTCAAIASLGVLGVGSKDAKHIKKRMHASKQEDRLYCTPLLLRSALEFAWTVPGCRAWHAHVHGPSAQAKDAARGALQAVCC